MRSIIKIRYIECAINGNFIGVLSQQFKRERRSKYKNSSVYILYENILIENDKLMQIFRDNDCCWIYCIQASITQLLLRASFSSLMF